VVSHAQRGVEGFNDAGSGDEKHGSEVAMKNSESVGRILFY
jgi:hypothetical protein